MVNLEELKRQAKEAEALVKRLERGEKATVRDSAGSTTFRNSHGGFAGKSLIQKIRDDLGTAIEQFEESLEKYGDGRESAIAHECSYEDGLIDGIAHALAILRVGIGPDHTGEIERSLAEAEYREKRRHEQQQ